MHGTVASIDGLHSKMGGRKTEFTAKIGCLNACGYELVLDGFLFFVLSIVVRASDTTYLEASPSQNASASCHGLNDNTHGKTVIFHYIDYAFKLYCRGFSFPYPHTLFSSIAKVKSIPTLSTFPITFIGLLKFFRKASLLLSKPCAFWNESHYWAHRTNSRSFRCLVQHEL